MTTSLPPLVLTGGPAAGKSATALALAESTTRTAFVDVDDVRQLVKNGGAPPWEVPEGLAQQDLAVRNTSAIAANFLSSGFKVTIADVLTARTLALYRELLPEVVVVRLRISVEEARRRAALRTVFLTDEEFDALHEAQRDSLAVDHDVEVSALGLQEQVQLVGRLWRPA